MKGGLETGKLLYDAPKLIKRLVNIADTKSPATLFCEASNLQSNPRIV
jgi:hypothetical protein